VSNVHPDDGSSDPDLPWANKSKSSSSSSSSGESLHLASQHQNDSGESQFNSSNQENHSPSNDSNQENRRPADSARGRQATTSDRDSTNPPRRRDNQIREGSPIRHPTSPTLSRVQRERFNGGPHGHSPVESNASSAGGGSPGNNGAPEYQIDRRSERWWMDPNGEPNVGRPGISWAEPPRIVGYGDDGNPIYQAVERDSPEGSSRRSRSSSRSSNRVPGPSRSIPSQVQFSETRDDDRNRNRRQPLVAVPVPPLRRTPGPGTGHDNRRIWGFGPHPESGLPHREFNVYIDPDLTHEHGVLGEPLLVRDPLGSGVLVANPYLHPGLMHLMTFGGDHDHGVIRVRVPIGWRVDIGRSRVEGVVRGVMSDDGSDGGSSGGSVKKMRLTGNKFGGGVIKCPVGRGREDW
jgi:hypothetical protein